MHIAHGFWKQGKRVADIRLGKDTKRKFSRGCQKNRQNSKVSIFYRDDRNLLELQSLIPHQ